MNPSTPFVADVSVSTMPETASDHSPARSIDFGAVFEATPAPSLVLSPQFTIIEVNAAYLRIVGRDRTDLVGKNIFDAFPDNPNDPHADGVANLRASLDRVVSTGRIDKMPVQKYDVATEVGSEVFLPRYWKPMNTPVLNAAGEVMYIIHSVEEMTAAYLTEGRGLRDVLASLTERIRDLKTAEEIGYEAAAILGEAFSASRVGYGSAIP